MRDLSTLRAVESLQKLAPEKFASDSRVVFDKNHGSHFFLESVWHKRTCWKFVDVFP